MVAEITALKNGKCIRLLSRSYSFSLDRYFKQINGERGNSNRYGNIIYGRYAVRCLKTDGKGKFIMMDYFDFRIIVTETDVQIIDRTFRTPYNALTALQMEEYMEVDAKLYFMDRMESKTREEADAKRKIARNPVYKLVCLCGLV